MTTPISTSTRWTVRRITYYALLTSVAIILTAVESMIPVPAPAGVKLGLANIITLYILLDDRSPVGALAVTAIRCVIAALALGTLSTLIFSFAGGIVSCVIMWFLIYFDCPFSAIGTSVAGALSHNLTQLVAASAIAHDFAILSYLPILTISGVAAGCATGFIALRVRGAFKPTSK